MFTCDRGYQLKGEPNFDCLVANGEGAKWNGTVPTCEGSDDLQGQSTAKYGIVISVRHSVVLNIYSRRLWTADNRERHGDGGDN